ncbi:MAG: GAF domain-containing protein, partial [candidate division NC10 bacterium]|nr:GAF domain-containing protein [candidate division NC10 bacterium]
MKVFFLTKKWNLIVLRWLMILVLVYLVAFGGGMMARPLRFGFLSLFLLSNLLLSFLPDERFRRWRLEFPIVILDTLLVSSIVYLSGDLDLYLVFFLTLLIAALGKDLRWTLLIASVSMICYLMLFLKYRSLAQLWEPQNLIRLPFLYIVSLFTSFLAEGSSQEEVFQKEAERLMRLTQDLTASIDSDKICDYLIAYLSEQKRVSHAAIFLCEKDSSDLHLKAGYPPQQNQEGTRVPLEGLPAQMKARLFNERRPYLSPQPGEEVFSAALPAKERIRSLVVFPCVAKEKVMALLVLASDRHGSFSAEEVQRFTLVCGQLALALESARLFTNLGQNAVELNTLINV